jgi:NAD(P)-dependent dehydrogenase (short-subunit alcohol dehydrogenase family)
VQHGLKFHSQVSSSKAAIEGLTRSLAAEYSPKVRFNCIAPSLTETSLSEPLLKTDSQRDLNAKKHPLQRIGQADDIANMAEFLISEKSSWISGQILAVDGGMSSIIL